MPRSTVTTARKPARLADHLIAWALGVAYVAILMTTADMGFTRDESFYFHAAAEYSGWFEELGDNIREHRVAASFTQDSVDRHWSYNPEHPVLAKTSFALGKLIFGDTLEWMSPSLALRFPAMVFAGLLLVVVFVFTREVSGSRLGALIAVMALATMPRFFFHAHLTCFDVPMTTVWVLFMYAYWRSLESTPWAWATGVLWGVALITKLNGFFLPLVLLAHWGLRAAPRLRVDRAGFVHAPRVPLALFTMALLGPVIFYAGWPRHWFDTWHRVLWYLRFHLNHEHYFVDFFGRSLWEPPFPVSFPFTMTATTTPLPTLVLFAAGGAVMLHAWLERRRRGGLEPLGTGLLIGLNILLPFAIIARPTTPIFGGVKHWLPALPFLCIVAGVGAAAIVAALKRWRPAVGPAVALVVTACIAVPAATDTAVVHPYGTSYYNALVGGVTGAADRGAMRQFWGYAARGGLDWLNEHAPDSARVSFQNTTPGAFEMYQREGWLREDIRYAWSLYESDFFTLHHQKSFEPLHYQVWWIFGTQAPAHTVTVNGVPVLSIYRNEHRVASSRAHAETPGGTAEDPDVSEGSGEDGSGDPDTEAGTPLAPTAGTR